MARRDLETGFDSFLAELAGFDQFGAATRTSEMLLPGVAGLLPETVPVFENEFWTSRQRAASSLHEVSYRACFKPQLPRFFIERWTAPGDRVLDPFLGRGTTAIEAALLGRVACGVDINPISVAVTRPRLHPPELSQIERRLGEVDLQPAHDPTDVACREDLLHFYHPQTLRELCSLRQWFLDRESSGAFDRVDAWLRMVALNRLTGHSSGFLSVYTLPPNQAVSPKRQAAINARRRQEPPLRDLRAILHKKSRSLLSGLDAAQRDALRQNRSRHRVATGDSGAVGSLGRIGAALCVTSPPFLDVVDYRGDNWLRCWFLGVDPDSVRISICRKTSEWTDEMARVLTAVASALRPDGVVAFEVGEVRSGAVRLEEHAAQAGRRAGLSVRAVMINRQEFTKTANCWGIDNNQKGTNSNRIVLFSRR